MEAVEEEEAAGRLPRRRMNPNLAVRGNSLIVLGGKVDADRREVPTPPPPPAPSWPSRPHCARLVRSHPSYDARSDSADLGCRRRREGPAFAPLSTPRTEPPEQDAAQTYCASLPGASAPIPPAGSIATTPAQVSSCDRPFSRSGGGCLAGHVAAGWAGSQPVAGAAREAG